MSFYYQALDDIDEYNQEFLAQLNHADEKIRFVALMNIGDEENPSLLPWLHAALQHDSSALVREEAAKKLESWEDPTSLQVLAQALFDVDLNVRQAASQSLSEVKNAASAQILAPYLKHTDTFALGAILRALKPLRPQQLFEEISALVHHEDAFVRREAVSALSWLQQDQAITILAKIAETDTDDEVRRIATYIHRGHPSTSTLFNFGKLATKSGSCSYDWKITYCSARSSFNSCCIRLVLASTYCSSTELGTT